MITYSLTSSDMVLRSDGVFIPQDPDNRDRAAFEVWLAAGGVAAPYELPAPPVPQSISRRQFFQQLAVEAIITEEQALASNAAVIPEPLLEIIEAMLEDQQFAAKMVVSGATTLERQHPMTIAIGAAYGMTSAQIDAFFAAAALL